MTVIVVGTQQQVTSLEPESFAAAHDHVEHSSGGAHVQADGQITITADPPPDNKYLIAQKSDAGPEMFTVSSTGEISGPLVTSQSLNDSIVKRNNANGTNIDMVLAETIFVDGGIELQNDASLGFVPFDSQGVQVPGALYRFGRQTNIGDPTPGLLDGLSMVRELDGEDQEYVAQLHPSQPALDINCTKDVGVDWLRIQDSSDGSTIFAVHNDGSLETPGWGTGELPDGYNDSFAVGSESLYIGSSKLSEVNGKLHLSHLKAVPHIPVALTQAPYSFTVNSINANLARTINDWMVLARSVVSPVAGKAIRLKNIFPLANHAADWDDAGLSKTHTLSEDVQAALTELRTKNTDNAVQFTTTRLIATKMRAINARLSDASVWLGDKTHISSFNGRSQLHQRKDVIPAYLQGLGVVVADVTALGKTIATCTLDDWETLSVNAGGSDSLSTIFPQASVGADFETRSVFSELLVRPHSTSTDSGLYIRQDTAGHPCMFFEGNSTTPGGGYGLIQFGTEGVAKSLMYHSSFDQNLHIDVLDSNILEITAAAVTLNGAPLGGGASEVTEQVWVDSSYGGGSSDGSSLKPYSSLSTALTAKLVDGSTTHYCFKLAPGVYTGAISIDQSNATQSFSIIGSGCGTTFIEAGATFSAGRASDVLYFRDFKSIEVADVCVRFGKYGFYTRNTEKNTLRNVRFENCGSVGTVNRHDQSGTQAEQLAYWVSTDTSDGGACRIRGCDQVVVHDCEAHYCARGLRIQDSGKTDNNSIVSGCKIFRTLEAAIYLAAGAYNGSNGCYNFQIVGNQVFETSNNGILVIGGQGNTVQGNNVVGSANSGIALIHGLDNRVLGNSIYDCSRLVHNGVGAVNGDSYGAIYIHGNTSIGTGSYIAVVSHNTLTKCNQGGAAAIYGINLASEAYPTASNKIIKEGNVSDAAVPFYNAESLPVVVGNEAGVTPAELGYLSGVTSGIQAQLDAAGGGSLGSNETIENSSGDASLTISSAGNSGPESSLVFAVDDQSNSDEDRQWTIRTDSSSHGELCFQTQWLNATQTPIRMFIDGNLGLATTSTANHKIGVGGTLLLKEDVTCWGDLNMSQYNKNITVGTGTVTCGTLALGGTSYTSLPSGPVMRVDHSTPSTVALTNETIVKAGNPLSSGSQNQTFDYSFPAGPINGRKIEFIGDHYGNNGASPSVIMIVIGQNSDHISAGSVGQLGGYQNNGYYGNVRLVCKNGHYTALFDGNTDAWVVSGSPVAGPP